MKDDPLLKNYRRRYKNQVYRAAKHLKVGMYAAGCSCHPGVITELRIMRRDPHGSDVIIKSLINGVEESCSILHCMPDPLDKDKALMMAKVLPIAWSKWREATKDMTGEETEFFSIHFDVENKNYVYGWQTGLKELSNETHN